MPRMIGRFEIRSELGRGAQSTVHLAWDPQLQREVAIKALHYPKGDPAQGVGQLAEARTVSRLRHPNLVPIFDIGESEGNPYLVLEYVEGRTLAQLLKDEGRIPPGRAADLMRQVADALVQAHALGIVHRDLKPSNILIDERGMPRVMDFGIATRISGDASIEEKGLSGTPAYMAPEYITRQEVSTRYDVFSAGLILLEMLTGRRVVEGKSTAKILQKMATEPVEIPAECEIGERLAGIVLRCCAHDPQTRYPSAVKLLEALDAYVNAGGDIAQTKVQKQGTLEFLLRRMRHKSDFPALSDSVSSINRLMTSEKESINKLSDVILRDYGLTNKILRLVNTAYYRPAGGGNISTVSRAIIVLGFDAVRNMTTTLLLFEHLQNKGNARELKEAFLRTNFAALLARGTSTVVMPGEREEAFICAMFYGLGRLLAQYYFPEEMDAVRKLMDSRAVPEESASARVLGLTFEELGIGIARTWGFPSSILHSMHHLPATPLRKSESHDDMLQLVAGFANETEEAIDRCTPKDRNRRASALIERFSPSLRLTENSLLALLNQTFSHLHEFASILKLDLRQSPYARQIRLFIGAQAEHAATGEAVLDPTLAHTILELAPTLSDDADPELAHARPVEDAQTILTAGIQDISNSLVEDVALADILRIILETIYRAMGFQRVLLCLKDAKSGTMIGRFGFGDNAKEIAKDIRFPIANAPDVFHLALHKSLDMIISDVDDSTIAERIPKWYREKIGAKTFVLFPLSLKNTPVALIYCDKEESGSIQISEKELALLKALRNQAMLALKQTV